MSRGLTCCAILSFCGVYMWGIAIVSVLIHQVRKTDFIFTTTNEPVLG